MKWQDLHESQNVEDRRQHSDSFSGGFPGGIPGSFPRSRRVRRGIPLKGKTGVAIIVIVLVAGYYGIDLTPLITGEIPSQPYPEMQRQSAAPSSEEAELARFSKVALKTTEDVWTKIFEASGKRYQYPTLVLYRSLTTTACGYGQAAMGPFYCPADQKLYVDLSFYQDMKTKLGGGGDFALGYVLAHEVGHHVQTLLGISDEVHRRQQRVTKVEANRIQVRMELQADCYAGVWGHYMEKQGILEAGDLEEALNTATAIGDDRLQREAQGRVVPDSFTHGTSEQRHSWFHRGFETGLPSACNTWTADFK